MKGGFLLENKNEKLLESISQNYFNLFLSLTNIQFVIFFVCLILKKSNSILHITPMTLLWCLYIMFKDIVKNPKEKDKSFTLLKASSVIFITGMINDFILSVLYKISSNPTTVKEAFVILILIDITVILFSVSILVNETISEKLKILHNTDTKSLLKKEKEEEIHPGDAVIGYSLDDNKPVILPLKDRYLHMLIIG